MTRPGGRRGAPTLEEIAEAAAKLCDVWYEFADEPDGLACVAEPLDRLDDLLIEAGYRPPPPPPPTPEEIEAWVAERVKANEEKWGASGSPGERKRT